MSTHSRKSATHPDIKLFVVVCTVKFYMGRTNGETLDECKQICIRTEDWNSYVLMNTGDLFILRLERSRR